MRLFPLMRMLVPLSLAITACGEDARVIRDASGDTAGGDVSSADFTLAFSAPTEGLLVGEDDEVSVVLAATSEKTPDWTAYVVKLTLNDDTLVTDGRLASDGRFQQVLSDLPGGAATLTATVTAPGGGTQTASVTFDVNLPPAAPDVAITPAEAGTNDALAAVVTLPADPTIKDGGALSTRYRWVKVGADPQIDIRTETLSADLTAKGDTFEVYVTVNDGFADSPEGKASLTIGNTAPVCNSVLLTPAAARVEQDLTCACTDATDADGDPVTGTCVFTDTESGRELGTAGNCTLPAGSFSAGMTIACTFTPTDGEDDGAAITNPESSNVLVLNSAPKAPVVALAPADGDAMTAFTCTHLSGGEDPDGDSVTRSFAWTLNDVDLATTATTVTPYDLGAKKGDALCCTEMADDGTAKTSSAPACTTLQNAPPPEVTVVIDSTEFPPTRRSVLTCNPRDAFDPDGEPLVFIYAWYVDGALIPDETGANFAPTDIPAGSVVSCTAEICDDEAACVGPIASKLSAKIQNALPTLADATVTTDDGTANADETATCVVSGWDDPDGDPQSVTYEWLLTVDGETTVIAGENGETMVISETLPVGATLTCRATPVNGDSAGPSVTSPGVFIGNPIPRPPVVALDAPNGADGVLTCRIVTAEKFIPATATRTWRWSINGTTVAGANAQTLGDAQVSHCDLVQCWQDISAPNLSLSSNKPSSAMPLGQDCQDENPCTDAICLQGGGCGEIKLTAAIACDDGDACTENESCVAGVCVGEDVCVEDRLSVGTSTSNSRVGLEPDVADGYLASFSGALRLTNGESSRLGEQLATGGVNGHAGLSPSGRVAILAMTRTSGSCNPGAMDQTSSYGIRIYEPGLESFTTLPDDTYNRCNPSYPRYVKSLAHDDESFSVIQFFWNTGWSILNRPQLTLQPVGSNLNKGAGVTLAYDIYVGPPQQIDTGEIAHRWDAKVVPDGTQAFILTWLSPDAKTVLAQRFSALGVAEFATPITVATTTQGFDGTSLTILPNGRFIVAWHGTGVDAAGMGLAARRFDETGTPLSDAFAVNEVSTGNQLLGGITSFADSSFVVTWHDSSTPTPKIMARIFGGTGVGTPGFVVNEKSPISGLLPAVTTLTSDDFVVAWRDAANVLWTRRFDKSGKPSDGAPEFRVNDEASNTQQTPSAAVATLSGNVMVAFASRVYAGTKSTEIRTRVFEPDGFALDTEQFANTFDEGAQATPVVAGGADRFVVAWTSELQDGSLEGIYAREYDEFGTPLNDEFPVNVTTDNSQSQPAVAMAADGSWVAAWTNFSAATGNDVKARVFPLGAPAGVELTIAGAALSQDAPAVAVVPGKTEFLVTWQGQTATNGKDIFVRRYGFDGLPKSGEFQVNTTVANDQRNPTLAAIGNDFFAVCWESVSQHVATKSTVVCQRFKTSTMVPQAAEYKVLPWADDQLNPHIAFQQDGKLAVTFQAKSLDSEGAAIHVVRVDELGGRVGERFVANRYWASEQTFPWVLANFDDLFVGWQSNLQDGSEGGIYFRILAQ